MRVLIVGSNENTYALAKKISELENVDLVFAAPGNEFIKGFASSVDILETEPEELAEFASANEINLTIITSEKAIMKSTVEEFNLRGLNIFAPSSESARIILSRSSAKKILYKLRIQTPKFGIFDRESLAVEYARKSRFPILIKSDMPFNDDDSYFCNTFLKAKNVIEKLFEEDNAKIVIEDYIDAGKIRLYFITDGYSALPLGSAFDTFSENEFVNSDSVKKAVFSPDYYISDEMLGKIMTKTVYPVIDEISKISHNYTGIIGLDMYFNGTSFWVSEFLIFPKTIDFQPLITSLKNNICNLCIAAVTGSLSDDYTSLMFDKDCMAAVEISNDKNYNIDTQEIDNLDNFNLSIASKNRFILTSKASTYNIALYQIEDYLCSIKDKVNEQE